jgi:hypothetical protein
MRRHLAFVVLLAAVGLSPAARAESASWIFRRSSFTHDPATGDRVVQFAPKQTPYVRSDPTYRQSAYRHHRSTIRVGGSADHTHFVETWGAGETIRPYGEWQFPFREGATPYGPWGNPQGPWTTPFGSWVNPYGLGRLPYYYWPPWPYGPYRPAPVPPSGAASQADPNAPGGAAPAQGGE